MSKIKSIKAREVLDSKGGPTVEVDLTTDLGEVQASVPSGVSKGKYEAVELKDGGERYGGMGVLKAVKNVNEIIAPKLIGKDPIEQKEIDELMIELDGTENKSRLGANTILSVSIAVCRAGALAQNLFLWKYIAMFAEVRPLPQAQHEVGPRDMPNPCILMIEGGLHAGNDLDVQEFMIVAEQGFFSEKLRISTEIYHCLEKILEKKYGGKATNIGDEGGFAPPLKKTGQALDLIMQAINKAGRKNKIKIILDVAASHFYKNKKYNFEGKIFSSKKLLDFYLGLIKDYPILGLEDPFSQDDWEGWKLVNCQLPIANCKFIIGDDLTATNPERIKKATENCINAVVIKPNQIGTVTETIQAAKVAQDNGLEIFVKHRGGETNDDFIADLAVGLGSKYIMAGAPCRGERVAKYNRLLKIERPAPDIARIC